MRRFTVWLVLLLAFVVSSVAFSQTYRQTIEQTLGRTGTMQGGVLVIEFPRSDLNVTVRGMAVQPEAGLTTELHFQQVGSQVLVTAEMVVLASEIDPVIAQLEKSGILVSALHNHLTGETPQVYFLHAAGLCSANTVGTGLRDALKATATPMGPQPPVPPSTINWSAAQNNLGAAASPKSANVAEFQIPLRQTVTLLGVKLLPGMDPATTIYMQAISGGRIAANGEIVCLAKEVNPAVRALQQQGMMITGIHNHFIGETPPVYYIHFMAVGDQNQLSAGLRTVLNLTSARP